MTQPASVRFGGSFRDPSSYVFRRDGRIFRALSGSAAAAFAELAGSGLLAQLCHEGLVVGTRAVDDPALAGALRAENPGFELFCEHDVIEPITYPYEWTFAMLAHAGILTLDLQIRLLERGLSLKDASAFNVQFRDGAPVFIDLGSVERPARLDVWYALGQFTRMFTVPLLWTRYRGWDLRSYFMANLDGRDLEQAAMGLGPLERWRPAYLLDVTLPLLLGRRAERRGAGPKAAPGATRADAQVANLRRLRRKLSVLERGYRHRGVWADYASTCSYDSAAERAKKEAVRGFLEQSRPARVLDLGCNTGDYSVLAAASGARVLALDADHDAVDLLYRRVRREPAAIAPVVASLAAPSPALGFRSREREALLDRAHADCVLALALLHHLLVTANLTFEGVAELAAELTDDHLVLEFVPVDDPMFERLVRYRSDSYSWVTLDNCRQALARRFTLERELALVGSPRTLLFLRKR